jgi:steroid delta-isomerase
VEGMDGRPSHPARQASIKSMTAIEAADPEAWVALFAEDAVVEDPVGPSAFDPEGKGHRGRAAIRAFYDNVISMGKVSFAVRESYAAGNEVANVGTITTAFDGGAKAHVDGVFTYRINDAGEIVALRALWSMDEMRMEHPG